MNMHTDAHTHIQNVNENRAKIQITNNVKINSNYLEFPLK